MSNRYLFCCVALSALVLVGGSGCRAKPASASRVEIQPEAFRDFQRENIRFTSNRFFLWPEGVTTGVVSRVMAISDTMDQLEREAAPLNQRLLVLAEEVRPIQEEIDSKNVSISIKDRNISRKTPRLRAKEDELRRAREAHQAELAKSPSDPAEVQRLERKVTDLDNERNIMQTELNTLQSEKATLEQDIRQLNGSAVLVEQGDLLQRQRVNEEEGRRNTDEVTRLVTWYDQQPTSVSFQFEPDGTMRASISGWTLDRNEGMRDFSSVASEGRKPTIVNLRYTERGGIFEFDVLVYDDQEQTQLRETYSFRIARTKYRSGDGKVYFSGKMKRIRTLPDGTEEVRQGVAKLVDRNN